METCASRLNVCVSIQKAGVLPPHPRSLVIATKNRGTLAASAAAQTSLTEESWKEELEGNPEGNESNEDQKDE